MFIFKTFFISPSQGSLFLALSLNAFLSMWSYGIVEIVSITFHLAFSAFKLNEMDFAVLLFIH